MIALDALDLVLFEELLEAVLVSLETEVHLIDVISGIEVDDILVLADLASASKLRP